MNRIRSTLQMFQRLSYSQKFALITLFFLIPVFAFAPLISDQLTNIDRYGVSELSGTLYLRSIRSVSDQLRDYVLLAHQYADQQIPLSTLEPLQSRLDESLEELGTIHAAYRTTLNLGSDLNLLQAEWDAVKASVAASDWAQFEARQDSLFRSIDSLTAEVGDTSYLILDPDLGTYYMMDTVLIRSPENQHLAFQSFRVAEQAMQHASLSMENQSTLIALLGRLETNASTMNRNIPVSIQNDETGTVEPLVASPLGEYQTNVQGFASLTRTLLSDLSDGSLDDPARAVSQLETSYNALHASESTLYSAASTALEDGIRLRIDRLRRRLIWMVILAVGSILTAFLVGRSMMKAISQPLSELTRAARLLSTGNMSTRIRTIDSGEIGEVSLAFNQMADELERDKSSLIARSAELITANAQREKRAQDLQTISEIARIISSEHRLDDLLSLMARTISDKLGFYHVGFFLLDDSRQFALLQAANSEGGQEMLAQGYRLRVGSQGIVSAAVTANKPQLAVDADQSKIYFANPFLPNTRSEVALPIRIGGELVGVLDIQSLKENAFTADDLDVFEILASQVGIAIQNARLYEQNAQSLRDVEEAYRRLSGSTWNSLLQQLDIKGFVYDGVSSRPLSETQPRPRSTSHSVPVTVRGTVIGNLRLSPMDPNRTWTEDELAIMSAVAERAALALEGARLLEDAQKRASRESFLSDVAAKLSTSFQLDSILRDTVEELGQTLSGSTVSFQLVNPSANGSIDKSNGSSPDRNSE